MRPRGETSLGANKFRASFTKPGEINHLHGGRGVYFDDPDGHVMEIITHSYGDRSEQI